MSTVSPTLCPVPASASDDRVDLHFLRRGRGIEFEMEVRWVERHIPAGVDRVVEIGCGNGRLLERLGPRRVIGVDLCADGLSRTRVALPGACLICCPGDQIPMDDGSANVVIAQHLLEHLIDHRAALAEWFRLLAPGGLLLLLTPNRDFADPRIFDDPTHVHLFDRRDLERAVGSSGFSLLEMRTLGLPWFRTIKLRSVWRLRRFLIEWAVGVSGMPFWRWKGQTLCCAACKPSSEDR